MQSIRVTLLAIAIFAAWGVQKAGAAQGTYYTKGGGYKLKDDRFAVFVVGEIRDGRGAYRDFVGLTKRLFMANGLHLYNDGILLETYGTAPMRAGKQFSAGRKTVKVHQNVLVFYKGDMRKIRDNFGTDFSFVDLSRFSKE